MIKNYPTIDNKFITSLRKGSEKRGFWYYFLMKEAKDRGLDINFARKGIRRIGRMNGEKKYPKTDDLREFVDAFMADIPRQLFEMELVSINDNEAKIEFHYCPMCGAWKQLEAEGADSEFLAQICDIAMEVDRGVFDVHDNFEFILGDTIASGCDTCQICIRKKSK